MINFISGFGEFDVLDCPAPLALMAQDGWAQLIQESRDEEVLEALDRFVTEAPEPTKEEWEEYEAQAAEIEAEILRLQVLLFEEQEAAHAASCCEEGDVTEFLVEDADEDAIDYADDTDDSDLITALLAFAGWATVVIFTALSF
jgi:hypothetical protein